MQNEYEVRNSLSDALAALRRRFEARSAAGTTPPAAWELLSVHVLYAVSGVLAIRAAVAFAGSGRPITGNALEGVIAMGSGCALLMLWSVLARTPPAEKWFTSHLHWLTMTYALLGAVFAGSLILLAVVMILVALIPPLFFLAYALAVVAWAVIAWFVWRLFRGYPAFLRRDPIGRLAGP